MTQDKLSELRSQAEAVLARKRFDVPDASALSTEEIQKLVHELHVHQIELEMQNEDLRQAQIKLEEMKDTYLELYDCAPVGYMLLNEKGLIQEANLTVVRLLGVERTSLLRTFFSRFVCEEFINTFSLYLQQVFESQSRQTCEIKLIRKDGTVFHAQLESVSVQDEGGQYKGCRTVLWDINERKQAEEGVRTKTHQLNERVKELNCLYNISKLVEESDTSLDQLLQGVIDIMPQAGRYPEITCARLILQDREFKTENYKVPVSKQSADIIVHGERIGGLEVGYLEEVPESDEGPFIKEERNLINAVAERLGRIIERKQAEEALQKSEERYRTVANFTYDWECWVSPDGNLLYISPSCERITGYSSEEFMSDPDLMNRIVHPDDSTRMIEHFHLMRTVDSQTPHSLDFRIIHRDGQIRWINHACQPVFGEAGQSLGRRVCNRDITERKQDEFIQRRLATAVEHAAEGIIITDAAGVIQYVNPAEEIIAGYNRDELIGQTPSIFKSYEHDQSFYKKLWETINTGNVWSGRFINKKKDGTEYPEDASISPVYDESGNLTNFVAVKRDVTEELKLQQQLLQAQKMEAIGTLAGGVAHDFNNLLQIFLGYSEMLLIDKHPDHPDYRNLQTINVAAERGADLVRRLMVFSRKGDTNLRPLNLNHEVTEVKEFLDRTIPKMITIKLSLQSWLPVINADPVQVEQILLNLAINAKDAMLESGGILTIETRSVTLDEEYCKGSLEAKPGHYVILSVEDTGHGMSRETIQHIFEPFFTIKGVGKGTGLGLPMVYGIVKQHGGFITCYSELAHGTTFRIYFPVVPTELEDSLEQESAVPPGGSETVLLVDDEESIRSMGSQILTRAGYTVLTATHGREAIDIYRNQRSDISLVILDLIMPEMGGKECFQELVNINPKVKVILSSGFLSPGTTEELTVLGVRGSVEKPHNMNQLLQTVREVLDRD